MIVIGIEDKEKQVYLAVYSGGMRGSVSRADDDVEVEEDGLAAS